MSAAALVNRLAQAEAACQLKLPGPWRATGAWQELLWRLAVAGEKAVDLYQIDWYQSTTLQRQKAMPELLEKECRNAIHALRQAVQNLAVPHV